MRVMMGGAIKKASNDNKVKIHVASKLITVETDGKIPEKVYDMYNNEYTLPDTYRGLNMSTGKQFDETCIAAEDGENAVAVKKGNSVRVFFVTEMKGDAGTDAYEITISPSTFPGTYYFVGDTLLRSETSGDDEPYQWVLPKGKISSEITFTMEADGDPATFEFKVNALRAKNESGEYEMMKFIKYNFTGDTASAGHADHNKVLLTGEERTNG